MTLAAPAQRHRPLRVLFVVLLVLAAGIVALALYLAHPAPLAQTATPSGTCPASTAVAYPGGPRGGAFVRVHAPGPDVVTVDIIAGVSARAVHMVQQVPAKDDLAEFSL